MVILYLSNAPLPVIPHVTVNVSVDVKTICGAVGGSGPETRKEKLFSTLTNSEIKICLLHTETTKQQEEYNIKYLLVRAVRSTFSLHLDAPLTADTRIVYSVPDWTP